MSNLKLNNLSIDLLQDMASIALIGQGTPRPGKVSFTAVNIQVSLDDIAHQAEDKLRKSALIAARKTLEEAIIALDEQAA